jgi:hypothetical protein
VPMQAATKNKATIARGEAQAAIRLRCDLEAETG